MSKAAEILEAGAGHMKDRAKTYDNPEGERSMEKCVAMFNSLTGHELTAEQGWHFMTCLKMVRAQQGDYRADNYEDGAAYFALAGEQAEQDRLPPAPEPYVSPGAQIPADAEGYSSHQCTHCKTIWWGRDLAGPCLNCNTPMSKEPDLGAPMPEEPEPEIVTGYAHHCEECPRHFIRPEEFAQCPTCHRKTRGNWCG